MTRKRFVKLLMARGYSRDLAQGYAQRRPARCSYAVYFPIVAKPFVSFVLICDQCHQSLHSVADSFQRFAAAVPNLGTTIKGGDADG